MTANNSIGVERAAGILMHPSSLPSSYGIGGFGKSAYDFVDFLEKSGLKYWQMLPLGHTGYGDSPYQCYSVVAGNPYFIDLDLLVKNGLLMPEDIIHSKSEDDQTVNFTTLFPIRYEILRKAYERGKKSEEVKNKMKTFEEENKEWLTDYAMFMALRNYFKEKPLWEWEDKEVKKRNQQRLEYYSQLLQEEISFYKFLQTLFFEQWKELKEYANSKGIEIIGDIPIYPSPDSADIWTHPNLFKVDENLCATKIAGVPPDYYSATGQIWGNPVYDWDNHEAEGYKWWISRIKHTMKIADVIRIDHFRGFQNYWEIPAGEATAVNGKWMPGPRMKLFLAIKNTLGDVPIIAEDLGIITDDVREFLKEIGYPGMRVMIFGLYEEDNNLHLPHNYPQNCIGYTSTHDSETFAQMVLESLDSKDKEFALAYINASEKESIGISVIRSIFASPAVITMVPMQDVLSLGSEGRMNMPATVGNNWAWRMKPEVLTDELAENLYKLVKTYKRLPANLKKMVR